MPSLFRFDQTHRVPADAELVVRDGKRTRLFPLTKDGTCYLRPTVVWCAMVRGADGRRKPVRFSTDKDAAAVMLVDLLKDIERRKAGVIDRFADHRKTPLAVHLTAWRTSLSANDRSPEYVAEKSMRVRKAFDACGFVFPRDLNATPLEQYLATLTVAPRTASKAGKMAKAPPRTRNHTLQALKQFVRWLVVNDRLARDPLARLKPINPKAGITRRRAEFSLEDLATLYAVTAERKTLRDLNGPVRVMLYRVAVNTGYRVSELAALTVESFDLTAAPPTVVLSGDHTKNGLPARQPIPRELARDLAAFLTGRTGIVWPGTWVDRSAGMLAKDMKTAGLLVVVPGPEGDETRDFHAFRATYITNVIRGGADLKQAMTLARHSDPKLTAGTYARARMEDLGALVNALPTGTLQVANQVATSDGGREGSETDGETSSSERGYTVPAELIAGQGLRAVEDDRDELKEVPPGGFEPPTTRLGNRCSIP